MSFIVCIVYSAWCIRTVKKFLGIITRSIDRSIGRWEGDLIFSINKKVTHTPLVLLDIKCIPFFFSFLFRSVQLPFIQFKKDYVHKNCCGALMIKLQNGKSEKPNYDNNNT